MISNKSFKNYLTNQSINQSTFTIFFVLFRKLVIKLLKNYQNFLNMSHLKTIILCFKLNFQMHDSNQTIKK